MEISEYFKKRDELQQQLRDLDKTFSEEHPWTKKYKGLLVRAFDNMDKEKSGVLRFEGVRLYGGRPMIFGHSMLDSGKISDCLMCECLIKNEKDIEVINN